MKMVLSKIKDHHRRNPLLPLKKEFLPVLFLCQPGK
jgi:hypothetical protein